MDNNTNTPRVRVDPPNCSGGEPLLEPHRAQLRQWAPDKPGMGRPIHEQLNIDTVFHRSGKLIFLRSLENVFHVIGCLLPQEFVSVMKGLWQRLQGTISTTYSGLK